ncbi:hypothetical protein ACWF94_26875 [Streptomyces sp. NPDC055078]
MKAARIALWAVLPGEIALVVALLADVAVPGAVLVVAESLVVGVLALETTVFLRLYGAARRTGADRRAALRTAVDTLVPVVLRRLLVHEVRALHSLGLWVLRRRHGVGTGAHAAAYTAPQTAMMWGMIFVSLVETVALAVVIPWPLVHLITLVIDVYGLVLMLAINASCVTRPHVVGADGSLRLRYGALFDLRIPARDILRARVERRYPTGSLVQQRDDGSMELIVGGQTTVAVELAAPVGYVRPLGRRGTAHTIRFHADDPQALVAALKLTRSGLGEHVPGQDPAPGREREQDPGRERERG